MPKRSRWRDPFADYIEWTKHRYDPGYYLGGNLPPHLRKASLGPRARRLSGMFLGVVALTSLIATAGAMRVGASRWELVASSAILALVGSAAIAMYRSGRPPKR